MGENRFFGRLEVFEGRGDLVQIGIADHRGSGLDDDPLDPAVVCGVADPLANLADAGIVETPKFRCLNFIVVGNLAVEVEDEPAVVTHGGDSGAGNKTVAQVKSGEDRHNKDQATKQ